MNLLKCLTFGVHSKFTINDQYKYREYNKKNSKSVKDLFKSLDEKIVISSVVCTI